MLGCSLSLNHECILTSQTAPGMPGKTPASASRCQAPRNEREASFACKSAALGRAEKHAFSFSHGGASNRQTTLGMSRKTRRKVEALSPLHASREEIAWSFSRPTLVDQNFAASYLKRSKSFGAPLVSETAEAHTGV
jgi:hypothetical protein